MQGNVLATAKVVLPISDEMDCKKCHASNSGVTAARPSAGWVDMNDSEKDFKYNVLRLHDERIPNAVSAHIADLKKAGYDYNTTGLEATARTGTPILCAACHSSNALPGTGVPGVKPFTEAMHGFHAHVINPDNNMSLNNIANRSACYMCHPGATTNCLRGAMGDRKDSNGNNIMQCQSCHGKMSDVGNPTRNGWFDEPNCQACHQGSTVYTSAIDPRTHTLRHAVDTRFATNPDTPAQGVSLYRFSRGHGGLQCEACHGSPHAIYPAHTADNLLAQGIQGHAGAIGECSACHNSVPNTVSGGPHGMHPVGWVYGHQAPAGYNLQACAACHGSTYRGTPLSRMFTDRTMLGRVFKKGHQVSCYDCHNGPYGGE